MIRCSVSNQMKYFAPMEIEFEEMPILLGGKWNWSAGQFKDQHRVKENWIPNQNILVFDFDIFVGDRENYFSQFYCLVGTTKSHNKEKNGIVSERYRVVFPVDELNISVNEYSNVYELISEKFESDKACKDVSRSWAPNPSPEFEYWFFKGCQLDWKYFLGKKQKTAFSSRMPVVSKQENDFMDKDNWERMFKPAEIDTGNRHNAFVRYALWSRDNGCAREDIEEILNWLNSRIIKPLPHREILGIVKSLRK